MLSTWVKQDNGSKAAQLYFIHLHISHLIDKLSENSEKKMQGFKALNKNTEPTLSKTLGTTRGNVPIKYGANLCTLHTFSVSKTKVKLDNTFL